MMFSGQLSDSFIKESVDTCIKFGMHNVFLK